VPYGYDADAQTKQLVVNESDSRIVKWMFEAAASGQLPAAIADAANRRGWRTKATVGRHTANQRGGNLWTARQGKLGPGGTGSDFSHFMRSAEASGSGALSGHS